MHYISLFEAHLGEINNKMNRKRTREHDYRPVQIMADKADDRATDPEKDEEIDNMVSWFQLYLLN